MKKEKKRRIKLQTKIKKEEQKREEKEIKKRNKVFINILKIFIIDISKILSLIKNFSIKLKSRLKSYKDCNKKNRSDIIKQSYFILYF